MRLFGLIGYPLTQSFSKKYFDEKFEREGLTDCRFENFPIKSVDDLKQVILPNNPDLVGVAVTIPYKQLVLQHLTTSVYTIPEEIRACNCIKISDGKLIGYNTDYVGFAKSFTPLLQSHHKRALVLGFGGSAAAVVYVLNKLGIEYECVSRKIHHGSTLTYNDLDEKIMKRNQVIINTTPLGMYPEVDDCPRIPYSSITEKHLVYDLIYNPEKTLFLQKAEQQGATIKNGADMLVYQAEENWKIWNS